MKHFFRIALCLALWLALLPGTVLALRDGAPSLYGAYGTHVEDACIYYTTQTVCFADESGVAQVLVNGVPMTDPNAPITLPGNVQMHYEIEVTDTVGNTATYLIRMKPIGEIAALLQKVTLATVKPLHRTILNGALDQVRSVLAHQAYTAQEEVLLQQLQAGLQQYLARVDAVQALLDAPALGAAMGYAPANATPADIPVLQNACAVLNTLLGQYSHNIPPREAHRLSQDLQRYTQDLAMLQRQAQIEGSLAAGIVAALLGLSLLTLRCMGYLRRPARE